MKVFLFFGVGLILFWLAVIKPTIFWLKSGHFYNYDFFDLLELNDSHRFSDWVGLNEILSWAMSTNIFFAWLILLFIFIDKLE